MSALSDQLEKLRDSVVLVSKTHGAALGEACDVAAKSILQWEQWYRNEKTSPHAVELLDGLRAAVLEAIAYVSLGLRRAAFSAIRTQIDLLLGYSYFRDHPVEWGQVCDTGKGFMLRSDIVKYHDVAPDFNARLVLLNKTTLYSLDELYKILSSHIHGQSPHSVPKAAGLSEFVADYDLLLEVVEIQQRVSESLSNFLLSIYAKEWNNLPSHLWVATFGKLDGPARAILLKK